MGSHEEWLRRIERAEREEDWEEREAAEDEEGHLRRKERNLDELEKPLVDGV